MTTFLAVLVVLLAVTLLAVVGVARCKVCDLQRGLRYATRYLVQYEEENGELKAVIHEASAKLAGRPENATPGVLDSLIDDVTQDLCEQEDKWEP